MDEPSDPKSGPLRICTRFLLPLDAEIFAARLEADGIRALAAFNAGEYAIDENFDPDSN